MDIRVNRFKLCDLRFHPFLRSVLGRLPEKVREIVLNDTTFQILTDDEIFEELVLRYEFGAPIKTLVYLNTKILMEPDHQIIHTIASEIAHYILKKEGAKVWEGRLDNLLIEWGFGEEMEAVRFDQAISESKGYKIGYDWAKKQSRDYLMQHFGLYFDEWNERGLGRLSGKEFSRSIQGAETNSIIDNIVQVEQRDGMEPADNKLLEKRSLRKAILAGIMTAVKDSTLNDFYSSKSRTPHHISC